MQLQRIGAVMPSTSPCEGEDLHGDGRWMAMVGRFEISVFIIVVIVFITVIIIIANPTVLSVIMAAFRFSHQVET